MTDLEEQFDPNETEGQPDQQVMVGLHPAGGVRLKADDVKLDPNEAFVLAGQLMAHANMLIHFGYMAQLQEQEEFAKVARSIQLPPGTGPRR